MATVVFNADVGDKNALYLWPSQFGISWGNWGGFDDDQKSQGQLSDTFSEADWAEAIDKAIAAAEAGGYPKVIVVRVLGVSEGGGSAIDQTSSMTALGG